MCILLVCSLILCSLEFPSLSLLKFCCWNETVGPTRISLLFSIRCENCDEAVHYHNTVANPWMYMWPLHSRLSLRRACACHTFHYVKRMIETIFVHRFTHGTMPLRIIVRVSTWLTLEVKSITCAGCAHLFYNVLSCFPPPIPAVVIKILALHAHIQRFSFTPHIFIHLCCLFLFHSELCLLLGFLSLVGLLYQPPSLYTTV